MSTEPYTPDWVARQGLRLTPLGELVLVFAGALAGIAWVLAMILALTVLVGGGAQ